MAGTIAPDFGDTFEGRRVLLTGHTGFKGGWMATWLQQLGAQVTGVALLPEPGHSFCMTTALEQKIDSRIADIRDPISLNEVTRDIDAELVVHMAAQPFVRRSYHNPAETFATNVTGTANVLDLARRMPSLKAAIIVTSDKCYENNEWTWGYREVDPMGGSDPYSASKGCTELVTQSYRRSFFADPEGPQLASVRAGNVFGGGDWGEDRLIPDMIRAVEAGKAVDIRSPGSIRPWQHVLEPLSGYMALAAHLLRDGAPYANAWNFGPDVSGTVTVRELADLVTQIWGKGGPQFNFADVPDPSALHEAGILRLDSTKAQTGLGWRPQLTLPQAVELTVNWYKAFAAGKDMTAVTQEQIEFYSALMAGPNSGPSSVAAE